MTRDEVPPGMVSRAEAWTFVDGARGRTVAALMRRVDYDGSQACEGRDDFIWDQWTNEHAEELRALCHSCPFLSSCADWALAHEEYTFAGGMTPEERRKVRALRRVALVPRDVADRFGLVGWVGYDVASA